MNCISQSPLRLQSEISRMIGEACHFFRRLDILTTKFQLLCIVWAILCQHCTFSHKLHCNTIMRFVESKPIRSNVTVPTTSFPLVLCHRKFVTIGVNKYYLHYRCSMRYDVIYDPFPINSQIFEDMRGFDSPVHGGFVNHSVFHH